MESPITFVTRLTRPDDPFHTLAADKALFRFLFDNPLPPEALDPDAVAADQLLYSIEVADTYEPPAEPEFGPLELTA